MNVSDVPASAGDDDAPRTAQAAGASWPFRRPASAAMTSAQAREKAVTSSTRAAGSASAYRCRYMISPEIW